MAVNQTCDLSMALRTAPSHYTTSHSMQLIQRVFNQSYISITYSVKLHNSIYLWPDYLWLYFWL